jgi:phosphatidate cytidylyltransferase
MSDDIWRRRERERDESSEFGGPLFPDDPADDADARARRDDTGERRLAFGPNDTGPLPHWTDPPTGEVPRMDPNPPRRDDDDDDVDVWSSFTTETPVWRDDDPLEPPDPSGGYGRDPSGPIRRDPSGEIPRDPSGGRVRDPSGGIDRDATGEFRSDSISEPMGRPRTGELPIPPVRQPGRITIGTGGDPSGATRRPAGPPPRRRAGQQRSGRPAGPPRTSAGAPASARNLPAAIAAGAILAALFIGAILWRPAAVIALIVIVLAVAGFEYFGKVTEKGYRPAVAPGLGAVVAAPLAAYWVGDVSLPLIIAFAFIAAAAGFLGATSVESGPLPNMAVTTLGIVWIGLLGSFAALIVRWSSLGGGNSFGTDTLFLVVLGVVANDIGALGVGSAIGRTPLRAWISPAKTLEGLLGGALATMASMVVFHLVGRSDTWTELSDLLILGVAISVMAPLGDLTESMFKRNLDVKDFGTVLSGHGGVLDRFDGFLLTLPVVYYLSMVLLDINFI